MAEWRCLATIKECYPYGFDDWVNRDGSRHTEVVKFTPTIVLDGGPIQGHFNVSFSDRKPKPLEMQVGTIWLCVASAREFKGSGHNDSYLYTHIECLDGKLKAAEMLGWVHRTLRAEGARAEDKVSRLLAALEGM